MKTIINKQFTLQGRDFAKGLLIAALTAVLTFISSGLEYSFETLYKVAIAAAASYLLKNWLEPTKVVDVTKGKEAKEVIASIKDRTNPPPFGDPTHPKR